MELPFISKLQKGKNALVVDVGSGSVAMAIVDVRHGRPSVVKSALREYIPHAERDDTHLTTAIGGKLKTVGEKFLQSYRKEGEKPEEITHALVVLHVPWIRSQTTYAKKSFEKETVINPGAIESLAKEAVAQLADSEPAINSKRIFETSIVRTSLNGYPTAQPDGKSARSLEVIVLQSETDSAFIKNICGTLEELLPGRPIELRSSTMVDMQVMRTTADDATNYTFVDITSEATSILGIHEGVIGAVGTVPIGTRVALRRAAKEQSSTEEEIESRLEMVARDACTKNNCDEVESVLDVISNEYTTIFGKILNEVTKKKRLPNTLFMRAHPLLGKWFSNFLSRVDFSQFTETTKPFHVTILSAPLLSKHSVFAPGVEQDAGIWSAATFVHNARQPSIDIKPKR